MKFQVTDILSDDMEDNSNKNEKKIIITVYGKTEDNKSIICSFTGYKPYFYMRIPKSWTKSNVNKFIEEKDEKIKLLVVSIVSLNLNSVITLRLIYVR